LLPLLQAGVGIARARQGDAECAVDMIRGALAQAAHARLTMLVTQQSLWLAEAFLLAGRIAEAIAQAERTADTAASRGEAGFQAWALWIRGAALARAGDRAASESYRRAARIAERHGMRPLLARCRAGCGG
jgi:ATP/maltotriose-dependent transcriptional regulator MalT